MENIITVNNLRKKYGKVEAIKGISFNVREGSLFAFLGPNGAGKSTTIDTLCTLISCDEGDVEICDYKLGVDDRKIRNNIGVVFQTGVLDGRLTIKENLLLRGAFYSLKRKDLERRIKDIANITGISDILDRKYNKLSGGQRRRADIARAIIHAPRILFLDEPTTGLDPKTRQSIWMSISAMQKELGMTVFLTTHYLEEATNADDIVILKDGMIAESGNAASLKEKYTKDFIYIYSENSELDEYFQRQNRVYQKSQGCFKTEISDKNTGVYVPMGILPQGVQNFIKILPFGHAAVLFRNILMEDTLNTVFGKVPVESLDNYKKMFGINFYFKEKIISNSTSLLFIIVVSIVCLGLFILNYNRKRKEI